MSLSSREFFALNGGEKIEVKIPEKPSIVYLVIGRLDQEAGGIVIVNLTNPSQRDSIRVKWSARGIIDFSDKPFDDFNQGECRIFH
ncbi:MAG: hypothetical protein WC528_01855 [Patescibacteria group bacterium]